MAHPSISEPNREGGAPASSSALRAGDESDLVMLVGKFAGQAGGSLPLELSVDLALEVILNEIVEEACIATRASGAAVLLKRHGEMACRASSGGTAPELGARLNTESGLTAECIRTRQMQRCDDTETDPRVDAEACRNMGVRSVMILPILRGGDLAGVLEVFSSQPDAFGIQEEIALQELGRRVAANVERASQPFAVPERGASVSAVSEANSVPAAAGEEGEKKEDETGLEEAGAPRSLFNVVTVALAAAVVACAVLMGTLIGVRTGWIKIARRGRSAARQVAAQNPAGGKEEVGVASAGDASGAGKSADGERNPLVSDRASTPPNGRNIPPGSLLVYENGKEVFRMAGGQTRLSTQPETMKTQPAPQVESSAAVEVLTEAAEGSLLYRVEPDYPDDARQQKLQGPVLLDVRVNRDGTVQDVKLLAGQPVLADAAILAVKQWRFKPRLVQGQPVEMETQVTLNFRLPQ